MPQMNINLNPDLYFTLKSIATKEERSLTAQVTYMLKKQLDAMGEPMQLLPIKVDPSTTPDKPENEFI